MANFTVNNTNDSGSGSLRQAILDANNTAGADTINFSIAAGSTIGLTSGELVITDGVLIDGDLDNNNTPDITVSEVTNSTTTRVFLIDDGDNATFDSVAIDGLNITGGNVSDLGNVTGSGGSQGGGIFNAESLILNNSNLSSNSARYNGGGIFNSYSSASINNSTLSGNSAGNRAGGISNQNSSASIANSTLISNSAGNRGGGIYSFVSSLSINNSSLSGNFATLGGGIFNSNSSASISNSTLNNNSANGSGGGIYNRTSTASISNSTLSNNITDNFGGAFLTKVIVV